MSWTIAARLCCSKENGSGLPRSALGPRAPSQPRIWTATYSALCASALLAYLNQQALLPVIPLYVRAIGEDEFVAGLVLGSFSLVSFLLRPIIGHLVDVRGAGQVFVAGALLLGAGTAGLLFPVIVVLLFASAIRGIGWAGVNTGANVLLAELAPSRRRGEAAGYFALFPAAASTAGPPLALWWVQQGGSYRLIFLACSGLAGAATLVATRLLGISGRAVARQARSQVGRGALIARDSMLPSGLLILVMFTQPAVLGFYPLYAEELGVSGTAIAAFYVLSGVSAVVARAMFGRVSDRASRGHAVFSGFVLIGIALLLLQGASPLFLLSAAVLYAAGHGLCQPALTALAIDRADPTKTGVSMATFSASYQIGMGGGSVVAGALITVVGYSGLYWWMLAVVAIGLAASALNWPALTRKSET